MKFAVVLCALIAVQAASAKLMQGLGDSCANGGDAECKPAYSHCNAQKKCACIDGFTKQGDKCVASKKNCPQFVSRAEPRDGGKNCEIVFDPTTNGEISHNCGPAEFCYAHVKTHAVGEQHQFAGHCCHKPPADVEIGLVCPLGQAHPTGTCPDTTGWPADKPTPKNLTSTCPHATHECIKQPMRRDRICCPKPCRGTSSHFSVDGNCFDTALPGSPCHHSAQCGGGSKCKPGPGGGPLCQCIAPKRLVNEPSPHCA